MKAQPEFSILRATLDDAAGILECLRLAFEPYRDKYSAEGFRDSALEEESTAEEATNRWTTIGPVTSTSSASGSV